ncbi:MAG: hypothetical protein HC887_06775, partial [Desulfobacteraceae bacterium]|nr:hypothetical protein [Desulfobacteraceae bacterium]
FEAGDDWFEIILPSLQLIVVKNNVPPQYFDKARFTLERLHLQNDERLIRVRQTWYQMYKDGKSILTDCGKWHLSLPVR